MAEQARFDPEIHHCPKCGGELEDCWDGELISAFIGEWSDDRFRCCGNPLKPLPFPTLSEFHPMNCTPVCGYFGLEDLGFEYRED
ncbi:hypothetical protein [Lonepinella koalarum]|uniref:hypothetical protein n=2 Tax=Lonepinella koalarum TaxID=53417 RepID=UPI003F6DF7BA